MIFIKHSFSPLNLLYILGSNSYFFPPGVRVICRLIWLFFVEEDLP
jgi:hypothetical protein